jgi:O-antigen/teichoic acid export membrane protein
MKLQLLKSVLLFAMTSVLAAAMPLLLMPVLTRVLTPQDYGTVAMFAIVLSAFGALTGLSVHGAVGMRYFDRDDIDFPRYVGNCLLVLLGSTFLCLCLVLLLLGPIARITMLPEGWLLAAVGVSGAQFILLTRLSIFQSAKRAGAFATLRLSQAAIDGTLSLGLVVAAGMAYEGRLIGMSGAILCAALASVVSLLRGGWIKIKPDRRDIAHALRFGMPLIPHVVGGLLLASVDRVMIANFIGIAETGIYLVAVQIGLAVYFLADAINRAISPWYIEALKAGDTRQDVLIVRASIAYFAGLICLGLALGFLAPFFLQILVGPDFVAAADLVGLIALGQVFGGMYLVVANVVFYSNRTIALSAITISCGILNAGVSYLMLQWIGLKGAALGFLVAQVTLFVLTFALAQSIRPLPWVHAWLTNYIGDR